MLHKSLLYFPCFRYKICLTSQINITYGTVNYVMNLFWKWYSIFNLVNIPFLIFQFWCKINMPFHRFWIFYGIKHIWLYEPMNTRGSKPLSQSIHLHTKPFAQVDKACHRNVPSVLCSIYTLSVRMKRTGALCSSSPLMQYWNSPLTSHKICAEVKFTWLLNCVMSAEWIMS